MKIPGVKRIVEKESFNFPMKVFLFVVILFLLDATIGGLLKDLYFRQNSGLLYRTTYAMDSTKADVLIFGSSTANHHYCPEVFEKRLHLSCYNTGRDGNTIFYYYAILQGVLKRYSPGMAILDFNRKEFLKDQASYDRISSLLPYYDEHPEIRSTIQLKSPFEKYKMLSAIYPYNSLIFTIAAGNAEFNKNRKEIIDQEGYVPLEKVWNEPVTMDTSFEKYELDSIKIMRFKSFIRECIKADIKLYIFLSPHFTEYKFQDSSIVIAKEIAREFNVPFYDFSSDPLFLSDAALFADRDHLNGEGAIVYSEKVIDRILQDQRPRRSPLYPDKYSNPPLKDLTVVKNKTLNLQ